MNNFSSCCPKVLWFHHSLIYPIYDANFYSHTFVVDILHGCATFFVQLYYINFLISQSLISLMVGGRMAQNSGAGGDNNLPPPPMDPTLLDILRRSEESRQAQNQILEAIVQNLGGHGHGSC